MNVSVSVPVGMIVVLFVNGVAHTKPFKKQHPHKSGKHGRSEDDGFKDKDVSFGRFGRYMKSLGDNNEERRGEQQARGDSCEIGERLFAESVTEAVSKKARG